MKNIENIVANKQIDIDSNSFILKEEEENSQNLNPLVQCITLFKSIHIALL